MARKPKPKTHDVIRRGELEHALLDLGGAPIDLADYLTTGLRVVVIGPSGIGKTNAGLVIAEQLRDQLAAQGWVGVLVDPEGEIASLYGAPVTDVDDLAARLAKRDQPLIVVAAENAAAFVPYGRAILHAADTDRRPLFVMLDEGQLFSAPRDKKEELGAATDLVKQFAERGRKRALDLFITAHRYTGSLHRSIFAGKNLTLIGHQEDPTAWSALAPQFRAARLTFADLMALAPGEFFCFSRRGMEKVKMPMAAALARVATKAKHVKPMLPTTFSQWDRAMREIPTDRLRALTDPVVELLGAVAGVTTQQLLTGRRALQDEIGVRG